MKIVIQRSKNSEVLVEGKSVNKIQKGMVIFSCFTEGDTEKDIDYIVNKVVKLRIFDDESGVMNKNIQDINGEVLSISQFTLYANTKKGNRPSYAKALNGKEAEPLYNLFNEKLNTFAPVKTGLFGADMQINIQNDGPTTIIIDTKEEN